MFKQQYTLARMSTIEVQRFYEILFYYLIKKLLKIYEPFNLVIDFIFSCGELFKCNTTILHRVVLKIIEDDMLYKPHLNESIILMNKASIPVRDIVELLDISNFTVYKYIKEYIANPCLILVKHNASESREIIKFLINFSKLKGIL